MGFFSGIFGSRSKWDALAYVGNIVGRKFWYRSFINLDEVRRNGMQVALHLDARNWAMGAPQSPKTMVGELISLFSQFKSKEDEDGVNAVVKAIIHLLENYSIELPAGTQNYLAINCYHQDIWNWIAKQEELTTKQEELKTKQEELKTKEVAVAAENLKIAIEENNKKKKAIKTNQTTYLIRGKKHIFDGKEFISIED